MENVVTVYNDSVGLSVIVVIIIIIVNSKSSCSSDQLNVNIKIRKFIIPEFEMDRGSNLVLK